MFILRLNSRNSRVKVLTTNELENEHTTQRNQIKTHYAEKVIVTKLIKTTAEQTCHCKSILFSVRLSEVISGIYGEKTFKSICSLWICSPQKTRIRSISFSNSNIEFIVVFQIKEKNEKNFSKMNRKYWKFGRFILISLM